MCSVRKNMNLCSAYEDANAVLVFNRLAFAVVLLKCGGPTLGPLALILFLSLVPAFQGLHCDDDGASVSVSAPRRTHGLLMYEMLYKKPWLLWPSLLWASKRTLHNASLAYGSFVLSTRVSITGDIRDPAPKHAFITCHHRMKLQVNRSLDLYSSLLLASKFDEVHIAIGFGGLSLVKPLMRLAFGTLDLVASKDPHWALAAPIAAARVAGRSCAVVVFPDRDGMQYWGDRSMCSRNGVYAAALALHVPIIDILALEPTAVAPDTLFHVRHIHTARPTVTKFCASRYTEWRQQNKESIQSFKKAVHAEYLRALDSLEGARGSCTLHEQLGTCDLLLEATINQSVERTLKASLHDMQDVTRP